MNPYVLITINKKVLHKYFGTKHSIQTAFCSDTGGTVKSQDPFFKTVSFSYLYLILFLHFSNTEEKKNFINKMIKNKRISIRFIIYGFNEQKANRPQRLPEYHCPFTDLSTNLIYELY